MLKKIVMTSLCTSGLLMAQSGIGINVNKTDLEIEGTLDSRNLAAFQEVSTVYLADFSFLNIESDRKDAKMIGAGFGATNKLEGVKGIELTFGAKLILSKIDDNRFSDEDWFSALPLMGMVRYTFPTLMFHIPQVSIESKLFYAPGALSFGDSDRYSEFRFAADIEMIKNVKIYAGYRNIITGYTVKDDYLFSNGFYGGLKFTY
jgi:hypothetical protein